MRLSLVESNCNDFLRLAKVRFVLKSSSPLSPRLGAEALRFVPTKIEQESLRILMAL